MAHSPGTDAEKELVMMKGAEGVGIRGRGAEAEGGR